MTLEKLNNRMIDINKSIEQTIANYNALLGAKKELEYWIKQLQESEMPVINET